MSECGEYLDRTHAEVMAKLGELDRLTRESSARIEALLDSNVGAGHTLSLRDEIERREAQFGFDSAQTLVNEHDGRGDFGQERLVDPDDVVGGVVGVVLGGGDVDLPVQPLGECHRVSSRVRASELPTPGASGRTLEDAAGGGPSRGPSAAPSE